MKGFIKFVAFACVLIQLVQIFQCQIAQPAPEPNSDPRPIPPIFTNAATSLKVSFTSNICTHTCTRRPVNNWSQTDWNLYLQLYLQANRNGWIQQIATEHNYDGNGRAFLFHTTPEFITWHRFFTAHQEQLLQQIDTTINHAAPGRFCLGYWDWSYHFNNDLTSSGYHYVFESQRLGTLQNGGIPNGQLRGLTVGGNLVTRGPSPGSQSWDTSSIAFCVGLNHIEDDFNNNIDGFRGCSEYTYHGAIHNSVGANFATFTSPWDPLFFLHHGMIDYLYWRWQQQSGLIYPPGWTTATIPRPYNASHWTNQNSLSYQSFCYTYQRQTAQTGKKSFRMLKQDSTPSPNADLLPPTQKDKVKQILSQPKPTPIPKDSYHFLTKHAPTAEKAQELYNAYVKYVSGQQKLHEGIKSYFGGPKQAQALVASAKEKEDIVKKYLPLLET